MLKAAVKQNAMPTQKEEPAVEETIEEVKATSKETLASKAATKEAPLP